MNIQVVPVNSIASFDYMLFPDQNPQNQLYIQQQLSQFSASLTDVGRKFVEASRAIYDKINDSNAIRLAKAAIRMTKGLFHPNSIVYLNTIEDIRNAQPVMQRYIMAEPTIREIYHQQRCDGYSDTYADIEPGSLRDDHYDYRRVMDHVIQDTVNSDGEYEWVAKSFLEELRPGDKDLTHDEKCDILSTWEVMQAFISAGKDPTNIFEGDLAI